MRLLLVVKTLLRATATTLEPDCILGSKLLICSRSASASSFLKQNSPRDFLYLVETPETNTNSSEALLSAYTGTPASRSSMASVDRPPTLPDWRTAVNWELLGLAIRAQTGFLLEEEEEEEEEEGSRVCIAWFWRLERADWKWVLREEGFGRCWRRLEQWFWRLQKASWSWGLS